MREKEKRHPEDRGADGEMIVEVAGGCPKLGFGLAVLVEALAAEAFVGVPVIFCEIEIVINQRSTGKSVIANAISANPGIEERQGEKKKKNEQALRFARVAKGRWAEVLLVQEQSIRRKLLLSPAAIITAQHHDVEQISQDRGRDLVTANSRGGIVPHDFTSALDIRALELGCSNPRRHGTREIFFTNASR